MPPFPPPSLAAHARLFAAALAVAAALAACQAGPAPVTPTDLSGIVQELNRGGIRVSRTVSGQTGCDDPGLAGNAVHLVVAMDDAPTRDAYLFRFRSREAWTSAADEVEACRLAYAGASGSAPAQIAELDISPFRMFGSGWDRDLRDAMEAALTKAAGDGGNRATSRRSSEAGRVYRLGGTGRR